MQLEEEAAPSVGESGAGDLDTYVSGLYSKPTPTSSPAGLFEVEQTGPVNYRLVGKDAAFDIDGYEANFISDAANSPFVEGSNVPDAVRLKIWNREMDAFQRLKSLIYDPDVPFVGFES